MAASAVRRMLSSSPLSFSRSLPGDGKPAQRVLQPYFGVPLSHIVQHEGTSVPNLIKQVADFILDRGLDQVGIFRVNGNAKVIEKLRSSFDRNGEAVLSDTIEVMAVACVLKLFLRELPETLIPESFTHRFVAAQEAASFREPDDYVVEMKALLASLPDCNYATLKYLCAFLVIVARNESANRMNANALATVFGPNMFRCMSGIAGLKEQGITNCVTLQFIVKYNSLFLENGEISPYNDRFKLSDVVLSIPSSRVDRLYSSSSKLTFQLADKLNEPVAASKDSSPRDGLSSSSSSLQPRDTNDPPKKSQPVSTPVQSIIQDSINQAILEYVFGETVEILHDSDDLPEDESDHSWSFSDDDNNRVAVEAYKLPVRNDRLTPAAGKASASDSDSETDSDGGGSGDQKPSDVLRKGRMTIDDNQRLHDKGWPTEIDAKSRRPVSGSVSVPRKDVEPASSAHLRATSAPSVRPSSNGTKENFARTDSASVPKHLSQRESANFSNNNLTKRGQQGSPKSPLAEKQAWSVPSETGHREGKLISNSHQSSADDRLDNQFTMERGSAADKEEACLTEFKRLTKHIHACKKKIKQFEEEFESNYGYKPMHKDKVGNKEVKKCLEELPEARRKLAELRGTVEALQAEKQLSGGNPSRKTSSRPRMEDTLEALLLVLKEKRTAASRPENLSKMTEREIGEEKLCVQKALLHFETLHGRPSTAAEKELMHPLYDRYRKIKRLLANQSNHTDDVDDIQSAPSNLSFVSSCTQSTVVGAKGTSVRSNRNAGPSRSHVMENVFTLGRNDAVHRQTESAHRRKTEATVGKILDDDENLNLNQLSLPRLMAELDKTKAEKKRLQLLLHKFEEEFQKEHGRKVQKYDQIPLEHEYKQYKTVKAQLKLLEVLFAKHQQAK